MRFEDFDILIQRGFLNDTREFDQYIAYGANWGIMQQIHIRGGGPNEVVKILAEKILLNPVLKRLTNLNNVGLLKKM